jgi:fucose permease
VNVIDCPKLVGKNFNQRPPLAADSVFNALLPPLSVFVSASASNTCDVEGLDVAGTAGWGSRTMASADNTFEMVPVLVEVIRTTRLPVLRRRMPSIDRLQDAQNGGGLQSLRPYARPLTLLYFVIVLRTLTTSSFSTFVPVMLTQRGLSLAQAGTAVSVYLFATGLGGFFGGPAADRFGPRRVIILSLIAAVPFLAIASLLSGVPFGITLAIGGFLLQSTLPVNVTFGQTIAPISAATVSSLMMGFAWGVGGLIVPFVGMLADHIGIDHTLTVMSVVPLVAAALALPLPSRHRAPSLPVTP